MTWDEAAIAVKSTRRDSLIFYGLSRLTKSGAEAIM